MSEESIRGSDENLWDPGKEREKLPLSPFSLLHLKRFLQNYQFQATMVNSAPDAQRKTLRQDFVNPQDRQQYLWPVFGIRNSKMFDLSPVCKDCQVRFHTEEGRACLGVTQEIGYHQIRRWVGKHHETSSRSFTNVLFCGFTKLLLHRRQTYDRHTFVDTKHPHFCQKSISQ